jgi:hypothetical protein
LTVFNAGVRVISVTTAETHLIKSKDKWCTSTGIDMEIQMYGIGLLLYERNK